jgi:hypothetical protein
VRFEDMITNERLDLAGDVLAEDFYYWPQLDLHGPGGVRAWMTAFRTAS